MTPQGVVLNPAALQQAIGTQVLQHAALTGEPIVLDEERLARILAIQKDQQPQQPQQLPPQHQGSPLLQNGVTRLSAPSTPVRVKTEVASPIQSPSHILQEQQQMQQQQLQQSPNQQRIIMHAPQPQLQQGVSGVILRSPIKNEPGVHLATAAQHLSSPPQQQQLAQVIQPHQFSQQLQAVQQAPRQQAVVQAGTVTLPAGTAIAAAASGNAVASATPSFQVLSPTKEQLTQAASQVNQQGKVVLLNVGGRLVPVQAVSNAQQPQQVVLQQPPQHQQVLVQQQPVLQQPIQQQVQQQRIAVGASTSPVKMVQIVSSDPGKSVASGGKYIQLTKEQLANLTPAQLDQIKQLIPNASIVE